MCVYVCSKSYKFRSGKRVFPKDSAPTQSMDVTDGPGPSQSISQSVGGASQASKVDGPMRGFTVYIIGRLSESKPKLTKRIESLGGRVVKEVSEETTICLSSTGKTLFAHVSDL